MLVSKTRPHSSPMPDDVDHGLLLFMRVQSDSNYFFKKNTLRSNIIYTDAVFDFSGIRNMVAAIHQDNADFRFQYSINACDVITSVDEDWVDFAKKNAAPNLDASRAIGQPLWDFIQGEITITLYKALFERVRTSSQATLVPYKCDSPTMIRTMVLRITPKENRVLEFKSNIISFEVREHIPILDLALPRTKQKQEICSLCRRIRVEGGEWSEIERALMREDFYPKRLPKLYNVICPNCKKLVENLPESKKKQPKCNKLQSFEA